MTIRIPSRSDSSRRSLMPSIVFSRTRSAIFSISLALFTWYGISVTTIDVLSPFFEVSSSVLARRTIEPRPVRNAVHDALAPDDVAAGREVGAGDDPQQLAEPLVTCRHRFRLVERRRPLAPRDLALLGDDVDDPRR